MKDKINILVTGTAGFIGFHLTNRLVKDGYSVVGLDNLNHYYDVNLKKARLKELGIFVEDNQTDKLISSKFHSNLRFIKADLKDSDSIAQLFELIKPEYVCHLAAQAGVRYSIENPMVYIQSNIVGFTNILEQSRIHHVKHLVFASSSSVYGLNRKMPFSPHDNTNHPVSLYAATKKSNELMAHVYSKLYHLPTTGLRFFTVYGPWGRPDMSPMLFAEAITTNKPIKVFNYGNMGRDFTYVDDIVEGVVRVMNNPARSNDSWDSMSPDPASSNEPFKIYNIGSAAPVKLMDYIEILENALGKSTIKEFLPLQPGDVVDTFCDISDLETEFGYKPETSLKIGLENFARWYKKYFKTAF